MFVVTINAEVLQFFDPLDIKNSDSLNFNTTFFMANDPVSLNEFFDDWSKEYHPKNGDNLALQDLRLDLGGFFKGYYLGYYYRYNVFIRTNRDFTDFYYTAKNKLPFDSRKIYYLELRIRGIKEQGLLLSKNIILLRSGTEELRFGAAVAISAGYDMQNGIISGTAHILGKKNYEISATAHYYYTHNYLYDLDVKDSNGFGFGNHFALSYINKLHSFGTKIIINDLFSRIYWNNLPYSFVNIQTENKLYDENGYIKYAPSINGAERYIGFIQKITPRYKLVLCKDFLNEIRLTIGSIYSDKEFFPYFRINTRLLDLYDMTLTYESRFKSFGIGFGNKYFKTGIALDELQNPSAFNLYGKFIYPF